MQLLSRPSERKFCLLTFSLLTSYFFYLYFVLAMILLFVANLFYWCAKIDPSENEVRCTYISVNECNIVSNDDNENTFIPQNRCISHRYKISTSSFPTRRRGPERDFLLSLIFIFNPFTLYSSKSEETPPSLPHTP